MKKALEILRSEIRSRESMIELFTHNPHNQAITEYTANKAKEDIEGLKKAVTVLYAWDMVNKEAEKDSAV